MQYSYNSYTFQVCSKMMIIPSYSNVSVQSTDCNIQEEFTEWTRERHFPAPFESGWNGAVSVQFCCTWTVLHQEESTIDSTLTAWQVAHHLSCPCSSPPGCLFKPIRSTKLNFYTVLLLLLKSKIMLQYLPSVHFSINFNSPFISWQYYKKYSETFLDSRPI